MPFVCFRDDNIEESAARDIWGDIADQFFLRERAEDIARFTQSILASDREPIILLRDVGVEISVATQIFVHTSTGKNLFPVIAAILDKLRLNIVDARLRPPAMIERLMYFMCWMRMIGQLDPIRNSVAM